MQFAEDWPNGAIVTCVAANDADIGENAQLSYQFDPTAISSDGNTIVPFRVDAISGCIFIDSTIPLDFETRPLYNLSIEV